MKKFTRIIKKTLCGVLLTPIMFVCNVINAQTEIPAGNVSGIWALANSPYRVNGHITVPNDSTLTIKPGVKVIFTGSYKLDVKGCVLAVGTVEDTITFTAEDHSIGWQAVKFLSTSSSNDTSKFIYCKLEYGILNEGDPLSRVGGSFAIKDFSNLIISHCLMQHNLVVNGGDEMSGKGGAIAVWNASPIITDNTIINNQATGSDADGGGIICFMNSKPLISNNLISQNSAETTGGGVIIIVSSPLLINNIITNNSAGQGGGLMIKYNSKPVIMNNTIAFNSSSLGGGIICSLNADPLIINTIVHGNIADTGSQVCIIDSVSDPVFVFCAVEDGKEGFEGAGAGINYTGIYENNISNDPDFVDTVKYDFRLSDNSPCIAAGVDSVEINSIWYFAPSTDCQGNPRHGTTEAKPDIGALENLGSSTGLNEEVKIDAHKAQLFQNYPNPFTAMTEIKFSLPYQSSAKLQVLDCLGRLVDILVEDELHAGDHRFLLNASGLQSGIYYYRLTVGNYSQTRKCIVVK